jgi:hypothetical protein
VRLLFSSLHAFVHHLVPHSAKIHGLTNEQQDLAVDTFETFGPIPRICINLVRDRVGLLNYENRCQAMVAGLTYHTLRHFVLDGGALDLDANLHTIFIVRRCEIDNLATGYLEPISANVKMQLMTTINKLQQIEQIELYHTFASLNSTKAVAGLVYESLCQTRLQEGITLSLKPAIKRKERKLVHWKSQGEVPASNSMDVDSPEVVSFPPNIGIVYEELRSVEPNRLHVPKARNQVALDSFFILGEFMYIFQSTVANSHDIGKGLEESLSKVVNILPPKTKWRFVFITPPGCKVDVKATPEVEKFLEGVTLYSAHLEIEQARGRTWMYMQYCMVLPQTIM